MPCSIQVLKTVGARLTDLRFLSLDTIYAEDNVYGEESGDCNQKASGLALAVYKELPNALPQLEGLYMETELNMKDFEWPAELACLKNLRCAAMPSIVSPCAVLTN